MRYNILILLAIVTSVVKARLTPEDHKKLVELSDECLKISGVDKKTMQHAVKGHFPDTQDFKEQLLCIAQKIGVIDIDGNHNDDEIKKKLMKLFDNEDKVNAVKEKCIKPRGDPLVIAKCLFGEFHKAA